MKRRLYEIQQLVHEPLLEPALEAVSAVELRLGNQPAIVAAADAVGEAAYKFAAEADGIRLSTLDPLIPQPSQYRN